MATRGARARASAAKGLPAGTYARWRTSSRGTVPRQRQRSGEAGAGALGARPAQLRRGTGTVGGW